MDMTLHLIDLKVFIPVVGGLIGFIIFWFVQASSSIKYWFTLRYGHDWGSANFIIFTKYLGGFSMGVLPLLAYVTAFPETTLADLGFGFKRDTLDQTVLWTLGLSVIVIPLVFFSARNPKQWDFYPQIRAKEWDRKMILHKLASWAGYLLGYEFLFRGLLLFPLVEEIGLWPAIAVNIGLYAGTHIPKSLSETIGAIPLSVVLCLLSVQTGTIWIAFFVHVAMAWTNTLTALRYHPEMKIVRKRRS